MTYKLAVISAVFIATDRFWLLLSSSVYLWEGICFFFLFHSGFIRFQDRPIFLACARNFDYLNSPLLLPLIVVFAVSNIGRQWQGQNKNKINSTIKAIQSKVLALISISTWWYRCTLNMCKLHRKWLPIIYKCFQRLVFFKDDAVAHQKY